jgi:hypothetical protein
MFNRYDACLLEPLAKPNANKLKRGFVRHCCGKLLKHI